MSNSPAPKADENKPNEVEDSGTGPTPTADLVASTPDARDKVRRAPRSKNDGPRVRAIPTHGGTTVTVSKNDFKGIGVDHKTVVFDFRKDRLQVAVGNGPGQISEEAAEALFEHEPQRFEPVAWDD